MAVDENRPPYVTFEVREVEDRAQSLIANHWVGKDVNFVVITRPGSRDTLDKEAEVWLKELREKGRKGEIPDTWFPAFQAKYDAFKQGETSEGLVGTPLKTWDHLGPAAKKTLIAAGILTVEDLASVPDQDLTNVGTGAMAFKQKAKLWLEAQKAPGLQLEKLSALDQKVTELAELAKAQQAEITRLRAFEPKPTTKP